eukprot:scaffold7041_cov311-Pinguiococcus_pyrenoidosus.AAC.9
MQLQVRAQGSRGRYEAIQGLHKAQKRRKEQKSRGRHGGLVNSRYCTALQGRIRHAGALFQHRIARGEDRPTKPRDANARVQCGAKRA